MVGLVNSTSFKTDSLLLNQPLGLVWRIDKDTVVFLFLPFLLLLFLPPLPPFLPPWGATGGAGRAARWTRSGPSAPCPRPAARCPMSSAGQPQTPPPGILAAVLPAPVAVVASVPLGGTDVGSPPAAVSSAQA